MRRIAAEEHFTLPELAQAAGEHLARSEGWQRLRAGQGDAAWKEMGPRTTDLGDGRIAVMDAAGIDVQVLQVLVAVQLLDAAKGTELSRLANDRVADAVRAHPRRLAALATIAPQDPGAAAAELDRAVTDLGLRGAAINSHTQGEYLDQQKFWPILEAAEALDVPIYLHPTLLPDDAIRPYLDYGLMSATWGFAAETSLHALRIILSGVFDRFPNLTIVLGHLGEHIPFSLPRIDTHHLVTKPRINPDLQRLPSEYFKENFVLTTSGMNFSADSIRFCINVMGIERVMFAADYPFEELSGEVEAMDAVPLAHDELELVYHGNAERVFSLPVTEAADVAAGS